MSIEKKLLITSIDIAQNVDIPDMLLSDAETY